MSPHSVLSLLSTLYCLSITLSLSIYHFQLLFRRCSGVMSDQPDDLKYEWDWFDGEDRAVPLGWSLADQQLWASIDQRSSSGRQRSATSRCIHRLRDLAGLHAVSGVARPARRITERALKAREIQETKLLLKVFEQCARCFSVLNDDLAF